MMSVYGTCAYGDCEQISKERAFGKFWCPRHMHILTLDGILDPGIYLRAIAGETP